MKEKGGGWKTHRFLQERFEKSINYGISWRLDLKKKIDARRRFISEWWKQTLVSLF
jgi:hypothetical protein